MSVYKIQKGVTLLELMLVLVIATAFLGFGIRLYYQYQVQLNETKILFNVNQLFQAMSNFYRVNCRQALDTSGIPQSSGSLDPTVTDVGGTLLKIFPLEVGNDLVTPGFISGWHPLNILLDNTPKPDQGYFVQFNRVIDANTTKDATLGVYACTGSTNPPSCDATGGAFVDSTKNPPATQSAVVTYMAQVAVKISTKLNAGQLKQYMSDMGAQCYSTLSGTQVLPCPTIPKKPPTSSKNAYLVWERSVSYYASDDIQSTYWLSQPYLNQFKKQYTNDPMAGLSGVTNETLDSSSKKSWYNAQNYLCGG